MQAASNSRQPSDNTAPQRTLPPPNRLERAIYALLRLLARLPLGVWRTLGAILGWLMYLLLDLARKRKRVADINLQLCFPELDAAQRQRIIRQHCVRLAQSLLDRIWLWHGSEALLQHRIHWAGDRAALLADTPTILFAPHFMGMDAAGMRLVPLVRPEPAPPSTVRSAMWPWIAGCAAAVAAFPIASRYGKAVASSPSSLSCAKVASCTCCPT